MPTTVTNRPTLISITFLNKDDCEMLPPACVSKLSKTVTEQGSHSNHACTFHGFSRLYDY